MESAHDNNTVLPAATATSIDDQLRELTLCDAIPDDAHLSLTDDNHQNSVDLSVVTFNMHGYNQGFQTIRDLICDKKADIFLLQEHWLTQSKLCKFEEDFSEYMYAGSSAMNPGPDGAAPA